VADPSGAVWRVELRLWRWRWPRWRRRYDDSTGGGGDPLTFLGGAMDAGLAGLVAGVIVAIAVVLSVELLFPLVVFAVEILIGVALVVWHIVRGRWWVVATSGERRESWVVVGGPRSRRFVSEVASALAAGTALPTPDDR
jgi:hypothetical protein